ncbi:MAG: ATP-binding protein [Burkholderiaceae bacterium]
MSLERDTGGEIVGDNIRAVQAIYFAYMLEEMRAFQVVERLAQLFSQGLLPIRTVKTKNTLLKIGFENGRLTAQDRRSLYARALGVASGEAGEVEPNRQFLSLWLRFLVAVAGHAEQHGAANVLAPPTATNAHVRKDARALAANASLHGDGLTRQMAGKLLVEVHEMIDVLGSRDVLHAYGARDAWQVVELVGRNELGETRNVARFRTQATAGSQALRWLAEHSDLLDDAEAATLASTPDGEALVDAVEQMIAVSDAPPGDHPAPPSTDAAPRAFPSRRELQRAARDLLDALNDVTGARRDRSAEVEEARGLVVVFHGDRHTGKTLAAYELAHELRKDVLRVDLSQAMSKYIGETEKNLDAAFRGAEEAGAVLLFDEADALLGKRSAVRDAHDRYANVDVAYLLQRLEEHKGPVILATNRRENIDEAFTRRLRHVVAFPRPR